MTPPSASSPTVPASLLARLDEYRDALLRIGSQSRATVQSDAADVEARTALLRDLAGYVADRERIDWLDDVTHQYQNPEFGTNGTQYGIEVGRANREFHKGDSLRAAIDAARLPSPPEDPSMSRAATTEQQQDQGKTGNDQQQEPNLSRDALVRLARFGAWAMEELRGDNLGADIDGGAAQDEALRLGVLVTVRVSAPCCEGCACLEYDGDFPLDCYNYPAEIAQAMRTLTRDRWSGPLQHCPSCGEDWPASAFRRLRFFPTRYCQVCRKCGPRFARFVHYMAWPLGVPRAFTPLRRAPEEHAP